MKNNSIPQMRTIEEAIKEIKSLDPKTAITKNYLRTLVVTGKIPVIKAGRKNLINMDSLNEYLCANQPAETDSILPVRSKIDLSEYRKRGAC